MNNILTALTIAVAASPLLAQPFEELDDAAIEHEIGKVAEQCAQMNDGDTVEEIFGIMLARTGDRCVLGPGELSPRFAEFLEATGYQGAGIVDAENIWIAAQPVD